MAVNPEDDTTISGERQAEAGMPLKPSAEVIENDITPAPLASAEEATADTTTEPSVPTVSDEQIKCPHCGVENPPGSKFCGDCGCDLRSGAKKTRKGLLGWRPTPFSWKRAATDFVGFFAFQYVLRSGFAPPARFTWIDVVFAALWGIFGGFGVPYLISLILVFIVSTPLIMLTE